MKDLTEEELILLYAYGPEPEKTDSDYTNQEMLEGLAHKAKVLGRSPKVVEVDRDYRLASSDEYMRRFGKPWNKVLVRAGLKPAPAPWAKCSDEELIVAIQTWSKEHNGAVPQGHNFQYCDDLPSSGVVCKRFGSLSKALHLAGLEPNINRSFEAIKKTHSDVTYSACAQSRYKREHALV